VSSNQQILLGEGAGGGIPNYIEEVFSTYLYTGNGTTQTITNNIDLSTKGGLVWIKDRGDTWQHTLTDSARGTGQYLGSNITNGNQPWNADAPTFTATGLTIPVNGGVPYTNYLTNTYVSWTFRKQPKFFDIVTYTGDGVSGRAVAHNLGSVPGSVISKAYAGSTQNWLVYHRSLGANTTLILNSTVAAYTSSPEFPTTPTATEFYVGSFANVLGTTYVAYLFAHNAGGFGLAGTDNVISCGSWTVSGSVGSVNLGYEPQFVIAKRSDDIGNWFIFDTMRGFTANQPNGNTWVAANTANAENTGASFPGAINATGWSSTAASGIVDGTYIYIAIRRGPMKVPTVGTSVFAPITYTGDGAASRSITGSGFPPDLSITKVRNQNNRNLWFDRLRGRYVLLNSTGTDAEFSDTSTLSSFDMNGISMGDTGTTTFDMNYASSTYVDWMFRRAPGFFDVVCYTGTGTSTTQAHNLGAVPELMIIKSRGTAGTNWSTYSLLTPTTYRYNTLQTDSSGTGGKSYGPGGSPNFEELSAQPTSTVINLASSHESNSSGRTFVAYLFATCAGVSKVGSYTGNGSSQTIACGFAAGSRFVMIKRTDNNGDWYVWDSARGIVAGNDPHLRLNATQAQVTTDDSVDTDNSGFIVNQDAATNVNVTSATYIFLAIA